MNATIRGICPVCARSVALLKDGRLGRHGGNNQRDWPPQNCAGWGQLPKEDR